MIIFYLITELLLHKDSQIKKRINKVVEKNKWDKIKQIR